ncbi:MAG: lpxK [Proteobacteria bacterium]|nr:lpxK [Pseudomonadota bacterium]
MLTPAFWWKRKGPTALLLAPFGLVYGAVTARRMRRPGGAEPPLPLVCVGNFVAGGAGKTPTAIALAHSARSVGLDPCFLTRGHGGRLKGPVLVSSERHTAHDVGDEALLLARVAPTVVARRRADAFSLLKATGTDLCIMDDGFQNPSVKKTFNFVVVDGTVGVGNGLPLPAGPLRAPLRRQMLLADAIIIYGDSKNGQRVVRTAARAGKPVFRAALIANAPPAAPHRRLYAFAGIGRPEKFFRSLEDEGYRLAARRAFTDHYPYRFSDLCRLLDEADTLDAVPVTTEKDAVRLPAGIVGSNWSRNRIAIFGVHTRFSEEQAVGSLLLDIRKRWMARHFS